MHLLIKVVLLWLAIATTASEAQRQHWQIGGSGLAWSQGDSVQVLIDFSADAMQPVYIDPQRSIFSYFTGWQPLKDPRELIYVEGETPRSWKGSQGNVTTAHNGTYMVDGDSTTFNPPVSSNPEVWYTIDLAVPVPAHRFGFFTPPRGFRANGTPFAQDAVPAYEVSIAAEGDPSWLEGNQPYRPVGPFIADVVENFSARVQIDFPRQYVRFVRYRRKLSLLDSAAGQTFGSGSGAAFKGSIADFELFGEGVPRQAVYRSKIFELGEPLNFGRLFWTATALRRVDGEWLAAPDAQVWAEVELRTGRDDDPNVYHEHTDRGGEEVVTRERYDLVLQPRWRAGLLREPRPGMRASIAYDSEHWSFWSLPFTESGQAIDLKGGTHLQLRVSLHSEMFDAMVRLDSLWIETAPLLASRVVGEVALLRDVQPAGGLVRVPLGEAAELAYDIRGEFAGEGAGFDGLRIRTGTRAVFTRLEMGDPPQVVEPVEVVEGEQELTVVLPERIGPGDAEAVRVVFAADVFSLAWTFSSEVFDSATDALPQPVEAGDASVELGTTGLRVLGIAERRGGPVRALQFSTGVLTPNGDGVHDEVEIDYALVGLPEDVEVVLKIFALDGRKVAERAMGRQRFGTQRVRWDGRDRDGALLVPGLYLIEVAPVAQKSGVRSLRILAIAY